jgi:hypothetical protein
MKSDITYDPRWPNLDAYITANLNTHLKQVGKDFKVNATRYDSVLVIGNSKLMLYSWDGNESWDKPTLKTMIKDVIKIFHPSVMKPVPNDKVEARREICKACPLVTGDFKCRKCGCTLAIKINLDNFSCPLGKW